VFPRVAHWRLRAGNGYKRRNDSDAPTISGLSVTKSRVSALMDEDNSHPHGMRCGWTIPKRSFMSKLVRLYLRFAAAVSSLRSPMLLAVRLYWGFQFAQTGWGKLYNLPKITEFFASLNIPFPGANAHFVSGLEFIGGILLMLGLGSRIIGFLLAGKMLVAYWTADHEALASIFSDPGKFYAADPYTFLFASLMVLIFGPGLFAVDALIAKRFKETA
jgi:putative oxidoreductase